MANPQQRPKPDAVESVVGPRAAFSGSLRSETSIRIDGVFEGGLIETPANLLITETARVAGDIVAKTVSILGAFQGTVRAERVELLGAARVGGALYVNSIYMDDTVQLLAEVNLRGLTRGAAQRSPDAARPIPVMGQRRGGLPNGGNPLGSGNGAGAASGSAGVAPTRPAGQPLAPPDDGAR
ncbi:MAG: bactofilin family protein [Caldilineaceae bacterium]